MRGERGKPKRPMTEAERLSDALDMIVEGNAPYIHDVAGASYNYGLSQAKAMLADALRQPNINVDTILKKMDELRFNDFYSTRQ